MTADGLLTTKLLRGVLFCWSVIYYAMHMVYVFKKMNTTMQLITVFNLNMSFCVHNYKIFYCNFLSYALKCLSNANAVMSLDSRTSKFWNHGIHGDWANDITILLRAAYYPYLLEICKWINYDIFRQYLINFHMLRDNEWYSRYILKLKTTKYTKYRQIC